MTTFVSHSDPGWAGKGENIDGWLTSEIRSLGVCACVCVCVPLHGNTVHVCAGEATCREEGCHRGHSGSKRGGQDRFHKGEAGNQ